MRNFAAVTVLAVTAVLVSGAAVAVHAVRQVEDLGLLAGQTSFVLHELPHDTTTEDSIELITEAAAGSDVSAALLVPDEQARPGVWNAFTFRGHPEHPAFGADLRVQDIGDGGDLDLRAVLAADGSPSARAEFLRRLSVSGFVVEDATPDVFEACVFVISEAGVTAIVVSTLLGLVIALVAESSRRSCRQDLRLRCGWSRRRIVLTEASECSVLVGSALLAVLLVLAGFLMAERAGATVWRFTALAVPVLVGPLALATVGFHASCSFWSIRRAMSVRPMRWRRVVVTVTAAMLVVLSTVDVHGLAQERVAAAALGQTLVAESAHGNDVVLGVGPTTLGEDSALGAVALRQLEAGAASMGQISLQERITVIGDATSALTSVAGPRSESGNEPLLLVPRALAADEAALGAAAQEQIEDGWTVQGRGAPRAVRVRTRVVPSTMAVSEAVIDWTRGIVPAVRTWPEVPVLVVTEPSDLAPNQLGTATANGEVRFADRRSLDRALDQAHLTHLVVQTRRVGAQIEAQLAEIRSSSRLIVVALAGALVAALLAALTLVQDHRERVRRRAAVRFLVGRHPAITALPFVLISSVGTAVVAGGSALVIGAPALAAAVLAAAATAAVLAVATSIGARLDERTGGGAW